MDSTKNPYDYSFDPDDLSAAARAARRVGAKRNVLEVGTGPGSISRVLKEHYGCRITGIEVDATAAERAAAYCERMIVADLEQAGLLEDALAGMQFERILIADVLEHLRAPFTLLTRLRPYLAADGCFVLSVPFVTHAGVVAALMAGHFPYADKGLLDVTHIHLFSRTELIEGLARHGLALIDHEDVNIAPEDTEFARYWEVLSPEWRDKLLALADSRTYQCVLSVRSSPDLSRVADLFAEKEATGIAWRDAHLARREAERRAVALDGQRQALEGERANLIAHRESLLEHQQSLLENQQSLMNELQRVFQSRSWKITAPLRWLTALFSKRSPSPF